MRSFRLLLTLLLCLTVPVSGWASLLSGPLCPQSSQAVESEVVDLDHHADSQIASHEGASDHQHQHCASQAKPGKPCKGDHCACGCGMGACSASTLSLAVPYSALLMLYGGQQAMLSVDDMPHAGARSTSPLRPPIA